MTDATDLKCNQCGWVRETTESNPTIVACKNCGSYDVGYADSDTTEEDA